MAKQSGLGDQLYIGGHELGCDIGSLSRIGGGPAALDMTGICKFAFERIGGLRDGGIEFTAFFNPETAADDPGTSEDRAHAVLSTLPTVDRIVSYLRGAGLGRPAACLIGKQINYDPTRGNDGALTLTVQALANGYGLEWGRQATDGLRTDTEATDGASLDLGASSAFGLQAWLHVMALDGDDVTVTLEGSSDDGAGDAFAAITGGAFAEVTSAPAAERIQTARDQVVERYIRVSTSGTFTSVTFAVVVAVNTTQVEF
jgi:hypothetical protein